MNKTLTDQQRATFDEWFADAWAQYEDKEVTSEIKAKVWALKAWCHLFARASSPNAAGAEGANDLNERATLAAGQWATSNTPIKEALAYRDGFIAGACAPAQAADGEKR